MLFNSLACAAFVVVVVAGHRVLRGSWGAQKHWLLAASWVFYATWSPAFLVLLVLTAAVDFQLARAIHRRVAGRDEPAAGARALLLLGLGLNLGALGFFKYGRFFYEQLAVLAPLPPPPAVLAVVVPLGISFYTFHAISYLIDTYRDVRAPSERFADFALYLAFFPQLIAGPITRWSFFGPQLDAPRAADAQAYEEAGFRIARGFLKKVVCADGLGVLVDAVYGDVGAAGGLEVAVAFYAYAFQLYFDFSGYTDIAIGLARLLGFRLPENFDHPFLAESVAAFWRRWHITLSLWLRDYLWVPITRAMLRRTDRPLASEAVGFVVTMLLGGLWHGAAWTFVIWGGLHGMWLAIHRAVLEAQSGPPRTPLWLRRLVTFNLLCATFVVFRSPSLAAAGAFFRGLVALRPPSGPFPVGAALLILLGFATHGLGTTIALERRWPRTPPMVQGAVYGLVLVLVGLFSAQSERFIYFQF
jgi:D-alanyl-lipoteichoic acid acyltransferase DltB (MBOAT superfamily)